MRCLTSEAPPARQAGNLRPSSCPKSREKFLGNLDKYGAGYTFFTGFRKECHGDGLNGLKVEGGLLAPVFAKNKRIQDPSYAIHVMLKGLQGPLGTGESYAADMMPPLETM